MLLEQPPEPTPAPASSSASTPASPAAAPADERPRRSLGELLALCRASDEAILEFEVDLEELAGAIRDKVDGTVEFVDYCRSRSQVIAKRAAELSAKARAFANKADGVEAYVAHKMAAEGAKEIPGNDFRFTLLYSQATATTREPTPSDFLKFPDLVKRSYAWRLDPIKKRLRADDAAVKAFASIKENPFVKVLTKA